MNLKISVIVAIAPERVIGKKGGSLLWHIPEDLRRFKELTTGHVVVMGRKTYETIGKPLPNRTNIIITRDKNYSTPGCLIVRSLEDALEKAKEVLMEDSDNAFLSDRIKRYNEIFVIGGGEIYEQAIGLADKLYLTLIHKSFEGDVYFPDYSDFKKEVYRQEGESANGLKFTWLELELEKE